MNLHLSGWQRLWLVASALLLAVVVAFTAKDWPTRGKVYGETAGLLREVFRDAGAVAGADAEQLRQELGGVTDREFVERLDAHHRQWRSDFEQWRYRDGLGSDVHDRLDRIFSTYDARIVRLPDERRSLLLWRFALWLACAGMLYLVGMGVGWVRHGFRR